MPYYKCRNIQLNICRSWTHVSDVICHTLVYSFELESSLAALRNLILSHNQLGPTSGSSLSSLLRKCASITCLYLDDCGLTSYTLERHTGLAAAVEGVPELYHRTSHVFHTTMCLSLIGLRGLIDLSLAYNHLGIEWHHFLVNILKRQKLCSLNLACTHSSYMMNSSLPLPCIESHNIVNQVCILSTKIQSLLCCSVCWKVW